MYSSPPSTPHPGMVSLGTPSLTAGQLRTYHHKSSRSTIFCWLFFLFNNLPPGLSGPMGDREERRRAEAVIENKTTVFHIHKYRFPILHMLLYICFTCNESVRVTSWHFCSKVNPSLCKNHQYRNTMSVHIVSLLSLAVTISRH